MAVDFGLPAFGQRFVRQAQATTAEAPARKPSEFWLNVGLPTGVQDEGDKFSFLSLPMGIPLDTMNPVELRGTNQEFLEFRAAQNHLLEQVMKAAKSLKPGESVELKLAVQLRRVSGEPVAPSVASNRFLKAIEGVS